MPIVKVTYKVKPERAEENEALIRAVFAALANGDSAGVRYTAFKEADGQTFVHVAAFDDEAAQAKLTGLAEFQAFTADIKERCEIPPSPVPVEVVGSTTDLA